MLSKARRSASFFIASINFVLLFGIFLPTRANAIATGGNDEGTTGCSAIGLSLDGGQKDDFTEFTANDFKVTFVSRNEILVTTTSPSKTLLKTGNGPTLGDIFGEGCRIYEDEYLTSSFDYDLPDSQMFTVDQFSNQNDINNALKTVGLFGSYDGNFGSVELTWAFAYGRNRTSDDEYYVLETTGGATDWDDVSGSQDVTKKKGLIITNIDATYFNRTLLIYGEPGSLSLRPTNPKMNNVVFSQGVNGTQTILALNLANLDEGYIAFPAGQTPESLVAATGFVDLLYYKNPTANPVPIKVLGGASEALDTTVSAAGGSGTVPNSCESEGGPFSFLLCPLLTGASEAIELLDGKIRSALEVKEAYYQDSQVKEAWARIRNVAYILLIPILLIMVIGTALGFNFMDAYTVKRAMPRLFVAVIFMALSFDITRILIEVTNGVGRGVGGLIAQPFGGSEALQFTAIFNPTLGNDFLAGGVGIVGGIALVGLGAVSIGILASYLGAAALALIIIFALLTVRELVIIFLMILSPLAILSWIFPGNDKLWKLWWNSFSRLLMIFPIIIGLLVMGRGFALLAGSVGASGIESVFIILVKLTAYIGPFFFIPAAFKFAGGAFANLAGIVNDRGKGLFDRNRKYRANKRKQLWNDAKTGNRFKSFGQESAVNKLFQTPGAIQKAGWRGVTDKGARDAARDNLNLSSKKSASEDYDLQSKMNNDIFAHALTIDDNEARLAYLAENGYSGGDLNKTNGAILRFRKEYGDDTLRAMAIAKKAGSKTSYTGGIDEMIDDIIIASKGDMTKAGQLLAEASGAAENAGRFDLSKGSFGEKFNMIRSRIDSQLEAKTLRDAGDTAGATAVLQQSSAAINARQSEKVMDSMTTFDYARMHPTAARNVVAGIESKVHNARAQLMAAQEAGDTAAMEAAQYAIGQAGAEMQNFKNGAQSGGSAEVARIAVTAAAKKFDGGPISFAGMGPGSTGDIQFESADDMAKYADSVVGRARQGYHMGRGAVRFAEGYNATALRQVGLTPEERTRQEAERLRREAADKAKDA